KNLDALASMQHARDLRIDPGNRLELARPVRLVMRPRDPGGFVRLPLCGKTKAHAPRYRLRIGAYASIRRSRRNGQFRRVSSISRGSHVAVRIAGSVPASASKRPNGSAM